jgi:hypothetical protein
MIQRTGGELSFERTAVAAETALGVEVVVEMSAEFAVAGETVVGIEQKQQKKQEVVNKWYVIREREKSHEQGPAVTSAAADKHEDGKKQKKQMMEEQERKPHEKDNQNSMLKKNALLWVSVLHRHSTPKSVLEIGVERKMHEQVLRGEDYVQHGKKRRMIQEDVEQLHSTSGQTNQLLLHRHQEKETENWSLQKTGQHER